MSSKIQIRRDTAANWASTNPVLSQGEPGLETDTNKVKYGDGSTAWTLLDYASGGGGGGTGDFNADWQDGINDNVWRKVTVQGTKEFDYQSEGWRTFDVTLTSDMLADLGNNNLTFVDADSALFADLYWNYSVAENNIQLYLNSDFISGNYNNYMWNMSSPSEGTYTFFNGNGDFNAFNVGDKITFKYWSEGTTYIGSYWDTYNEVLPDVSSEGATNEITFDTNEYNWMPWSNFITNVSEHSLSFTQNGENDFRNITNVVDNGNGTYTATFDGAPRTIRTMSLETVTFQAISTLENTWDMQIPKDVLPGSAAQLFINPWNFSTNTRKYIGGTLYQRSGYLTINGTDTYDFYWYWNFNGDNGNPYITFALQGSQVQITINQGDTIELNYYSTHDLVQLDIYSPNSSNWNNGYKWFDWKTDLPAEYHPSKGNGVIHGKGTVVMKTYQQASDFSSVNTESLATSFGWTTQGDFDYNPYDPYYREDMSNWGYSAQGVYPMYDFDEYGVIAYSDNRYYDFGYSYKVRIMYEFEVWISEESYNWFNC